MKIFVQSFLASALFLLPLVSCSEKDDNEVPLNDGEQVEVKLNLALEDLVEITGTPTRGTAIDDTNNQENNQIKNLWIIQFNGTEETSQRVGNPVYIDNYNSKDVIKLIASTVTNRLVLVANTFAETIAFADCNTYAEAKALAHTIAYESEVVHSETTSGVTTHYPVMNGEAQAILQSGITISSTLKHNVARIDMTVTNNVSGLTMESVTLMSVPNKMNYITNYSLPTEFPEVSSFSTINYAPTAWADGAAGDTDQEKSFTFYMPANKRGTTSDDTNYGLFKGNFSPDKATYALVKATYQDGGVTRSITYSFYLGANLINDFNIEPNGHYTYNFTINNKGDQDYDGRVDDGLVDFRKRELANCYIINPPKAEDSWRNYRVPVKRVYDFWKVDNKYEDNSDYALLNSSPGWIMDIIWSDFPITSDNFQWVMSNKTEGLTPDTDYFEFKVKEGTVGNVVVGIHRYTDAKGTIDGIYLWSWHLWITDYNPDKSVAYTIPESADRYSYDVPGGNVHRYNNDYFHTGIYKGKVMMDRNLGARDIYYHGGSTGDIYYQYGRKDPFTGPKKIYLNGTTETTWSTGTYTVQYTETGAANYNNVPYSIHHPLNFIKGGYWTYNDKYNPNPYDTDASKILWQDPYATTDNSKSFFDPCPPGWKVPKDGTWSGFNHQSSGKYDRFIWNGSGQIGRYYYPKGSTDTSSGTIFFPASGGLNSGSGGFLYVGSSGNSWSCSPDNATGGYGLGFGSGNVYPSNRNTRAYGFPVRCVQE